MRKRKRGYCKFTVNFMHNVFPSTHEMKVYITFIGSSESRRRLFHRTETELEAKHTIKRFEIHKRSKYRANRQEAVPFERHRIQNNGKTIELCVDRKPVGFRVVGKVPKLFKTRNDTDFLRKEVKLVKTRLRKWYIAIPVAIGIKECDQEDICALDPGVRTFQTVYGTDGAVSHVGTGFDAIEKELFKAKLSNKILELFRAST